jgi:hypothetical protein
MRASGIVAAALVLVSTAATIGQTVNLRPGKYETIAQMDMPGSFKMEPQKETQCITNAEVKDFWKIVTDADEMKNCKMSDQKQSGNKVTFNLTCEEEGLKVITRSELTFAGDSFTGLMTSKSAEGHTMTIKTSAKRVGECTK